MLVNSPVSLWRLDQKPEGIIVVGRLTVNSQMPAARRMLPRPRIEKSHDMRESTGFDFRSLCLLVALLLPATLGAEDHQVVAKQYYLTFSAAHPMLLRVKPGDVIATKTLDSSGYDEDGEARSPHGNPLTGPFFVEGAEEGDALRVHLWKLQLNRNWGSSCYRLGLFAVTPEFIATMSPDNLYPDRVIKGSANLVRWDIDLAQNMVRLRDPASGQQKLEFTARPMLGCIGVAPEGDFTPTSGPAGSYGGNLDYNEVRQGATVLLPVFHPGALLYIGDGHALQGDGEPTGNGIETSLNVEFSVDIVKQAHLTGPRVETPDYIISVGAQPEFTSDLNRGLQVATTDMVRWLTKEYKMESWVAQVLVAFQSKYDVITIAGSVGLKIPKRCLPNRP
jgi:acetamidase/formamidase